MAGSEVWAGERTVREGGTARAVQRLEKVMQDAGIKLTSVAGQAYSKSARVMLVYRLRVLYRCA
jgi:hypothetical protein